LSDADTGKPTASASGARLATSCRYWLAICEATDEPPPEVAATGHDRCIIPLKLENIDAWLHPDPSNLAAQYAILDDRRRPYYEHRLAA
jgi:hypothetical protein